jgi:hypothetical protein
MPQGLSIRAYARHRRISHTAVQKAVRTKRISLLADGSIDPAIADREWMANTDETKPLNSVSGDPKHRRVNGGPSRPVEPRAGAAPELPPTEASAGDEFDPQRWTRVRTAKEGIAAKLLKLELDREEKKVLLRSEVLQGSVSAGRRGRDRLLALRARLKRAFRDTDDAAVFDAVVDDGIAEVIAEASIPFGTPEETAS